MHPMVLRYSVFWIVVVLISGIIELIHSIFGLFLTSDTFSFSSFAILVLVLLPTLLLTIFRNSVGNKRKKGPLL